MAPGEYELELPANCKARDTIVDKERQFVSAYSFGGMKPFDESFSSHTGDMKPIDKPILGHKINQKTMPSDSICSVTKANLENRTWAVNAEQFESGTGYGTSPSEDHHTGDVKARTDENHFKNNRESSPGDITHVRKHVLDGVQKALDNAPAILNEPYTVKYSINGIEVEIHIKSVGSGPMKRKVMDEHESPPASPGLSGQSILRTKVPKTTLANEVKEYFINLLVQCNVPLGGTGKKQLPWTTLTKTLSDHNLEIINWPSDVPMPGSKDDTSDDNKGIKGMRLDMLVKLHAAIKRNECPIQIREASPARTKESFCPRSIDYSVGGGFQGVKTHQPMQCVDYFNENLFHGYGNSDFNMNSINTPAGYYDPRGDHKRRRVALVQ